MKRTVLPLREDLRSVTPYGAPQDAVAVRLNVNENPYPLPEAVVSAIVEAVGEVAPGLNRYADRDALGLRRALCDYLRDESGVALDAQQVWAANGSNEVMLQLFQAYGGAGTVALSAFPTYSMYHEYARDTQTGWVEVQRREDFRVDVEALADAIERHRPALVVLASPNNPTGTALEIEDVERIASACVGCGPLRAGTPTDSVLVIDEAYAEFRRRGRPSALTLLGAYPHMVVTRTMSKAFSMAGLRLGYCAASKEVVAHLQTVRLPYHLSALSQVVARVALAHRELLLERVDELRQRRDDLVKWLRELGWQVADSDANFVLVGRFSDREAVFTELRRRGILIRVVGPSGWLRISVGSETEDAQLRAAFKEVTA